VASAGLRPGVELKVGIISCDGIGMLTEPFTTRVSRSVIFREYCFMLPNPPPRLSVNLNKVALLRNARTIGIPCVRQAARQCLDAGAHGITVHPRPDQRHIRPEDVYELPGVLRDYPEAEYNIEGNPFTGDFMDLVRAVRPDQCTLVPDDPTQSTSDHGWNAEHDSQRLQPIIKELQDLGIRVSLFMDAEPALIEDISALHPERIELYTEPYATAFGTATEDEQLQRFSAAAAVANTLGLGVNAGHDLNLDNLPRFVSIPGILECSIGHALIADALTYGLANTVQRYQQALSGQRP
jgi:pyridoxine 5-phosphate synthase